MIEHSMTQAEIDRMRAGGADIDEGEARWYMLTPAEQNAKKDAALAVFLLENPQYAAPERRSPQKNDVPPWVTEYNAAYTWDELLQGDGWQLKRVDTDGTRHWTRPGKDTRKGSSATTGYSGIDKLRVFTTALDWLPCDDSYSRWAYMVHRDFGGDFRAASRAIRAVRG